MTLLYERFLNRHLHSNELDSIVLDVLVKDGNATAIKEGITLQENMHTKEGMKSWCEMTYRVCDAFIKNGGRLTKDNIDKFYSMVEDDICNGDEIDKLSGILEKLIYVRFSLTGVDAELLKALVFTMKSAVVNYLEGREYVANKMMEAVLNGANSDLKTYRREYNNILAIKSVYRNNGKKSKSPHKKLVEDIIRLTTEKYDNVSVSGLVEKITIYIRETSNSVPPTEKSIRVWVKNIGYKPQKPFLDKRKYSLIVPRD